MPPFFPLAVLFKSTSIWFSFVHLLRIFPVSFVIAVYVLCIYALFAATHDPYWVMYCCFLSRFFRFITGNRLVVSCFVPLLRMCLSVPYGALVYLCLRPPAAVFSPFLCCKAIEEFVV